MTIKMCTESKVYKLNEEIFDDISDAQEYALVFDCDIDDATIFSSIDIIIGGVSKYRNKETEKLYFSWRPMSLASFIDERNIKRDIIETPFFGFDAFGVSEDNITANYIFPSYLSNKQLKRLLLESRAMLNNKNLWEKSTYCKKICRKYFNAVKETALSWNEIKDIFLAKNTINNLEGIKEIK